MCTLLFANSELSWALCIAFTSLRKASEISGETCLSSMSWCTCAWKAVALHGRRVADRFKCLIRKNINLTALCSIQNNECMLVLCLVTSGLVWLRNKVIIAWLPQMGSLSMLLSPALAWGRGTVVPTRRRTGQSLSKAWIPHLTGGVYLQALKWGAYMTCLVIPGCLFREDR